MPKPDGATAYAEAFMRRVMQARRSRGLTQDDIAELLQTSQTTYSKYETRSFMPHDLIPRFCLACGIDANWLITGKGKAPAKLIDIPEEKPTRKRGRKPAKAA